MCYPYVDTLRQEGPRIECVELILQRGNYEKVLSYHYDMSVSNYIFQNR